MSSIVAVAAYRVHVNGGSLDISAERRLQCRIDLGHSRSGHLQQQADIV